MGAIAFVHEAVEQVFVYLSREKYEHTANSNTTSRI